MMPAPSDKVVRIRGSRKSRGDDRAPAYTPPHNREAEQAAIGACIIANEQIETVRVIAEPEHFFDERHRVTMRAVLALADRGVPVDLVTLKEELSRGGQLDRAGAAYVASLVDGVPKSANAEHWARIVRLCADERAISYAAQAALAELERNPAGSGAAIDALQLAIEARRAGGASAGDTLSEPIADLAARLNGAGGRQRLLGDLVALGEIAMLHGQPRDGKSWLSLEIAVAVAVGPDVAAFGLDRYRVDTPRPVLLANGEDGPATVVDRVRALLSGHGLSDWPANLHIIGRGLDLDDPTQQARIIAEAKRLGAALVILDPLRSLTACVDQGPADLRPFGGFLRRLVRETGAALLLVHHDVKPPANGPDTRRRAQKASGGALFSIVDAPIHVERVDERRSLVAPDGFKFTADPAAFVVERTDVAGGVQLRADDMPASTNAADVTLQARIRAHLSEAGGAGAGSGSAIAKALHVRKESAFDALDAMERAGIVDSVVGPRGRKDWFLAVNS